MACLALGAFAVFLPTRVPHAGNNLTKITEGVCDKNKQVLWKSVALGYLLRPFPIVLYYHDLQAYCMSQLTEWMPYTVLYVENIVATKKNDRV